MVDFSFSNPVPTHLSNVYGTTEDLYLTVTVSGEDPSYEYAATFYNAFDQSPIGLTVSGIPSGTAASGTMTTTSGGAYSWYLYATSSGYNDTSNTYSFINNFLCAGYTEDEGTRVSGISVRLYRRSNGYLVGQTTSTGVNGEFQINSIYDEEHYAVALHVDSDVNALIYDHIEP